MLFYILFILLIIFCCISIIVYYYLKQNIKKIIPQLSPSQLFPPQLSSPQVSSPQKNNDDCNIYNNINNVTYNKLVNSIRSPNYSFLNYNDNITCCLVEKNINLNNCEDTKFMYTYNQLNGKLCNPHLYRLDNNKQLLFNNNNCNSNTSNIGSCRKDSRECIDFVTKDFCDKYNMIWSNKTCNDSIQLENPENSNFYNYLNSIKNIENTTFKLF